MVTRSIAAAWQPNGAPTAPMQARISAARLAQREWANVPLANRLRVVRQIRDAIATQFNNLCEFFPDELAREPVQRLTAEIIPLADAARFLEREAKQILGARRLSTKSRPLWMNGANVEVRRDPFGVVLIVGPANYPLFIPGVQTLQALVAGNAVVLKPGRACAALANAFRLLAVRAGVPPDLFLVLNEDIENVRAAINAGVDKVVATGSVETGRAIYRQSADNLVPAVLELSGADPVFVLPGADLERAVNAIVFGCRWNNGNTCIAPRRIFVTETLADELEQRLRERAVARFHLSITRVGSDDEALHLAATSRFALGASVFGEQLLAQAFAARVHAGIVTVNDIIAPTADPRVPFGGRGWSGFGTTRGAEGLLEFTSPKAIVTQTARRLRHIEPLPNNAGEIFAAYLAAIHQASWTGRLSGWRRFLSALLHGNHMTDQRDL